MDGLKKLRNTPVSELMTTGLIMIDGSRKVAEAIALMAEHGISSVVIRPRNEDDTYGVLVERDILEKVVDPRGDTYMDIWNTQVHQVMTKPWPSVYPEMRVKYALRTMRESGIRRLLVIDQSKLVGLISENNILKAVQALPENKSAAI